MLLGWKNEDDEYNDIVIPEDKAKELTKTLIKDDNSCVLHTILV